MSKSIHALNAIILAACVAFILICLDRGSDGLALSGWCAATLFHTAHWVGDTFKASREA
mgnify:CR=1 FL=1